jgi:TonB family protein
MLMPPSEPPRRRIFSGGLLVSLVFHVVVVGLLAWFAAREGMLGQPLKQITVRLMPPPPPPKPSAPEKSQPEPPREKSAPLTEAEPPKVSVPLPAIISTPLPEPPPPVAAPAPAEMPSLVFDGGGKTVQTENDPAALYRSFVEFSLRARWNRPADIVDEQYLAEVEVAVDAAGRLSDPRWKRKSGDARWDASVMDAIQQTRQLDRPPPAGFPMRMTVRFDVIQSAELNLP